MCFSYINYFNSTTASILSFFADFSQQYAKQLYENLLSLVSVTRIDALNNGRHIYLRVNRLLYFN